jgi:hypothetical protein
LSPNDFAFGSPIIAAKAASAYRIAVPLAVYQRTFRDDLADIRVFNAAGQIVPYTLKRKAAEPQPAPVRLVNIASVMADPAGTGVASERSFLDVLATRDTAVPQEAFFDLEAHPPVDRLNVLLPEVNTMVNVEISSRREANGPWRTIARAGLFRLAAAEGDSQNAPIEVALDRDRYWKVRQISGGSFSQSPLRFRAQWIPDQVTFLARGSGPFLLAYGSSAAAGAQADLSLLPANVEIEAATTGDSVVLGGPERLKPHAAPMPRSQFALWGALLFAVAGLAWMASRLMKEQKAA